MNQKNKLQALSVEYKVDFVCGKPKAKPKQPPKQKPTKQPRITRLLALAHHLQDLIDKGVVTDYADIARLSGLTRARVTQIMNLTLLAPKIQKEILFVDNGKLSERTIRKVLKEACWEKQLEIWKEQKG
jgi:hypothetical protein